MNRLEKQNLLLVEPLTPREEENLMLLGDGKTNRQIANELLRALSTVKWYARQIYSKLNRWQTAAALRENLIKIT